ncbi:MAG: hypothetical protein EBV05_03700 [Cyanobacteria bacterium WB6_1B_304]|nr:hypothetical protein [Cyanobacteria bacterium WB6_1B_304]
MGKRNFINDLFYQSSPYAGSTWFPDWEMKWIPSPITPLCDLCFNPHTGFILGGTKSELGVEYNEAMMTIGSCHPGKSSRIKNQFNSLIHCSFKYESTIYK